MSLEKTIVPSQTHFQKLLINAVDVWILLQFLQSSEDFEGYTLIEAIQTNPDFCILKSIPSVIDLFTKQVGPCINSPGGSTYTKTRKRIRDCRQSDEFISPNKKQRVSNAIDLFSQQSAVIEADILFARYKDAIEAQIPILQTQCLKAIAILAKNPEQQGNASLIQNYHQLAEIAEKPEKILIFEPVIILRIQQLTSDITNHLNSKQLLFYQTYLNEPDAHKTQIAIASHQTSFWNTLFNNYKPLFNQLSSADEIQLLKHSWIGLIWRFEFTQNLYSHLHTYTTSTNRNVLLDSLLHDANQKLNAAYEQTNIRYFMKSVAQATILHQFQTPYTDFVDTKHLPVSESGRSPKRSRIKDTRELDTLLENLSRFQKNITGRITVETQVFQREVKRSTSLPNGLSDDTSNRYPTEPKSNPLSQHFNCRLAILLAETKIPSTQIQATTLSPYKAHLKQTGSRLENLIKAQRAERVVLYLGWLQDVQRVIQTTPTTLLQHCEKLSNLQQALAKQGDIIDDLNAQKSNETISLKQDILRLGLAKQLNTAVTAITRQIITEKENILKTKYPYPSILSLLAKYFNMGPTDTTKQEALRTTINNTAEAVKTIQAKIQPILVAIETLSGQVTDNTLKQSLERTYNTFSPLQHRLGQYSTSVNNIIAMTYTNPFKRDANAEREKQSARDFINKLLVAITKSNDIGDRFETFLASEQAENPATAINTYQALLKEGLTYHSQLQQTVKLHRALDEKGHPKKDNQAPETLFATLTCLSNAKDYLAETLMTYLQQSMPLIEERLGTLKSVLEDIALLASGCQEDTETSATQTSSAYNDCRF